MKEDVKIFVMNSVTLQFIPKNPTSSEVYRGITIWDTAAIIDAKLKNVFSWLFPQTQKLQ